MNKYHFAITGANGLLGGMLCWRYGQAGHRITALVRDPQTFLAMNKSEFTCLTGDLAKPKTMADEVGKVNPDLIVHCAALTNVDYCEDNPEEAIFINEVASEQLAARASQIGAGFVYISSDSVYGKGKGPHKEEDAGGALSVYAQTKLNAEEKIKAIHPSALILRTCHFGFNLLPGRSSLAEWMLGNMVAGKEIGGFVDACFSPLYTKTSAEMILAATRKGIKGIYNLGSSDGISKYRFALQLANELGFETKMVTPKKQAEQGFAAIRPPDPVMDSSRFYEAVALQPPTLSEEIDKFIRTLRDGKFDIQERFEGLL